MQIVYTTDSRGKFANLLLIFTRHKLFLILILFRRSNSYKDYGSIKDASRVHLASYNWH